MFRWLKDRGRKNRKGASSPTGSVRSKDDDYGFKQKLHHHHHQHHHHQQTNEYKRDLPPTPADLMTSCHVTDDDKSLHIYEEIPDLPFRCTPEGELRIHLAREEASRKERDRSALPDPWTTSRGISPYMVVPLERLQETPSEFRAAPTTTTTAASGLGFGPSSPDKPFACAVVGRKRPGEGGAATCAGCESPATQGACSSPSCCGSSVFGSPLCPEDSRCGSAAGGVDMSERLLSAINLTRLLAAVRLSSSSAETCTTSPICIGVDKDGRNISVSVTPTSPFSHNHHHHHHNSGDSDDHAHPDPHPSPRPHDAFPPDAETSSRPRAQGKTGLDSQPETARERQLHTGPERRHENPSQLQPQTGLEPEPLSDLMTTADIGFVSGGKGDAAGEENVDEAAEERDPDPQDSQASLRYLPSPTEQTALTEILQLRPGEKTELDPAMIDALLLRLCSHTLQGDAGRGWGPQGSFLHPQELEAVENMLKDMLRRGEEDENANHHHDPSSSSSLSAHPSPAVRRRGENSDTGFEYDVSTSSESDQANYDYFLSKAAHTRRLECEVKKLIDVTADSVDGEEDGEEEGASEAGESVTTLSTLSLAPSTPSLTPDAGDSDDGTMADLSESENSSGYYESARQATDRSAGDGATRGSEGRGKEGGGGGRTKPATPSADSSPGEHSDVELPCYELRDVEELGGGGGAQFVDKSSVLHEQAASAGSALYSRLGGGTSATGGLRELPPSTRPSSTHQTSKGKCTGRCRKPRHHHNHHHHHRRHPHHHHRQQKDRTDEGGEGGVVFGASPARHSSSSSSSAAAKDPADPTSPASGDLDPCRDAAGGEDLRRGSTDAVLSKSSLYSRRCPGSSGKPHRSERRKSGPEGGGGGGGGGGGSSSSNKGTLPSTGDYPYSLLYAPGVSPTRGTRRRLRAPKTRLDLERSASFQQAPRSQLHVQPADGVYSEASRQASEVYSLPAALPDPQGGGGGGGGGGGVGGGGGRGVGVGRQGHEDSEVYGTRAGLQRCHNRLLSDLILLNYNRQVLNM